MYDALSSVSGVKTLTLSDVMIYHTSQRDRSRSLGKELSKPQANHMIK